MTEDEKRKRVEAVRKTLEKRDRVDLVLPLGTKDRMKALGFDNPSKFCRVAVLDALEKYEAMR